MPLESKVSLSIADGLQLQPCGTMIVPLTFDNNKTFRFQMLVVLNLLTEIVFGNNHLCKTDAELNLSCRKVRFCDKNMNFEQECRLLTK